MRTLLVFVLLTLPASAQNLTEPKSLDEVATKYAARAADPRTRWHPSEPNITVGFNPGPVGDASLKRWEETHPGFRKGEAPGSLRTRLEFERYYRAVKALEAFDRRTK